MRIDLEATRRTIGALLEGNLDVAIVSSEPRDRSLRLHPLFEDDMLVVLSADHPLARRDRLRPRDLTTETVLVYRPKEDSLLLRRVLEPAGVAPAAVLEVPLTEAILEMAAAGVGIGFLARWAIDPRLRAGLVARPITRGGFRRRWAAATLRSAPLPAYVEEFLRLLTASTEGSAARPRIASAAASTLFLVDTRSRKVQRLITVKVQFVGKSVGVTKDQRWITFMETAGEGNIWLASLRP